MKLHLHAFLITALAVPAFCQTQPVPPIEATQPTRPTLPVQPVQPVQPTPPTAFANQAVLADQVDQLARDAEKMAAQAERFSPGQVDAIEAQAAKIAAQFDSGNFDEKIATAEEKAAEASERAYSFQDVDAKLSQMNFQFDSKVRVDLDDAMAKLSDQFAFLQNPNPKPFPMPEPPGGPKGRIFIGNLRGDGAYDAGTSAIDQHKYDDAVRYFDMVINAKSARADGALYWKAYALNRAGKRDDALASISQLRRDYSSSSWLNDAQALEAEVRQSNGQPISPAQEGNDDLKLLAINSLMNADAERAIPLIEGILKGNATPHVKDKALFVLVQSKSPRAQQVLTDYAKGGGNPDLQLHAIQYVGMSRTKESQQLLVSIYMSSADTRVKNAILQSLMGARATDALMSIAKSEKDPALRNSAIRNMANDRSVPVEGLLELYTSADVQAKRSIAEGLQGRRDAKSLVDLARKESDPAMKKYIVERLGDMRDSKEAMDYMIELLK